MTERGSLVVYAVLVLGGLCAYLKQPDDVVWHFVQGTSNVRVREHICFAIAAVTLALSLLLRVQIDTQLVESRSEQEDSGSRRIASEFLQAVGIGSLMPLAGFILLVLGQTAFSVLRYSLGKKADDDLAGTDGTPPSSRHGIQLLTRPAMVGRGERRKLLSRHAGLFCAFVSMVTFSITLSDRLADYLFAGSALIAILANLKRQSVWR